MTGKKNKSIVLYDNHFVLCPLQCISSFAETGMTSSGSRYCRIHFHNKDPGCHPAVKEYESVILI